MKEIIPDYFRKIADYAGISYEFLTPVTRDEYIAYQKNKDTTDISIDARLETDNYAETKKWELTAPFITMQLARVTRREFDGEINVVTVWVLLIFGWLLTTMAVIECVSVQEKKLRRQPRRRLRKWRNWQSMHGLQTRQKQHFCHICPMILGYIEIRSMLHQWEIL